MHLLDEVFNFTYDFNKTYEENLKEGLNYVIGYALLIYILKCIYINNITITTIKSYNEFYIIKQNLSGYDADKVEQSIKRSIVSITRTGAELKKIQASHPYGHK